MRHRHLGLLCLAIALAPLPALANTVIERAGLGRDCFIATLQPSTPLGDQLALATCDRAVADAGAASGDDFNRAAVFVNRADIRLRLKDYQGAVDDSEQAIALDPGIGVAYLNRGAGLVGLKNYADAVAALDKAITMGTNKPQLAYYNRGIARESLGDVTGAYHDYKMAVEADKTFALASEQLTRFTVKTR